MLRKINFAPGIDKDDTAFTRAGGFVDANWVRFQRGKWQVIGGYEEVSASTFTGLARGATSWQDNSGNKIIAWGTHSKLYAYIDGSIVDITPNKGEGTLEDPFETKNGSAIVTVTHDQHGLDAGDTITFSHAVAVGGITVDGAYTVTEVLTSNKYTITHSSTATTATGGGNVDFVATFDAGNINGSASASPRVWTLDNWGENLIACPVGGAIYEWQPALSYADVIVGGDMTSAADWTIGANWNVSGVRANHTAGGAGNLSQDIEGKVDGGKTYRLTFDFSHTSGGTVTIGVNAGVSAPAIVDIGLPINQTGSYSRLITMPAEPLDIVFQAETDFAGWIDNVTLSLEENAYRIDTAPAHNNGIMVSSDRTVVAFGTVDVDGNWDPLEARWSDRENNRSWVPGGSSIAGSLPMSAGGKAVAGLASREQNLIWTDGGVFALIPSSGATAYTMTLLGEGCGAIGPLSVASYSGRVFWVTNDGIPYTLQSSVSEVGISQPMPIESGVKRDFFENIASNQQEKIQCWINPKFNEFWLIYPDSRDGTEVSRYQAFNWVENHWTVGSISRTTIINSGTEKYPVGFGTDNKLYRHEKGTSANGGTLSAFITTGDFALDPEEQIMHVRRMVPDFEDQSATITVRVYFREWPQSSQETFGPYSFLTTSKKIDFRATGRFCSVKYEISSTDASARSGTQLFDVIPTGQRR